MGQALYRKYRSKSLDEIIGQEHITQTLKQALEQGRISHAYLFTGPRGVGKTSIARIWAHEINGIPYDDDSAHLDIIEIDAASNRRIDEIRELRDKVYIAPTSAKYKVYIIDEVHMLTREAFNALLKTLEEPPAHAVFILATTDAHKLPDTIISRTQRYSFKPVATDKVISHLRHIAKTEDITVADDALTLLAEHGEGSFRDSISLLDQASSNGSTIELADVQQLLGIPPTEAVEGVLKASMTGASSAALISSLTDLYGQGYQAATIAKRLGESIRTELVNGASYDEPRTFQLLEELLRVPTSHNPERFLEIVLLQARPTSITATVATTKPAITAEEPTPKPVAPAEPAPATPTEQPEPAAPQPEPNIEELTITVEPVDTETVSTNGVAVFDEAVWPNVLQALKQKHNTLYGVIRMAQPTFSEGSVQLAFSFAFHQKRVNEASSRKILSDIIATLTGQEVSIVCIVDSSTKTPEVALAATPKAPATNLSAISNIFGSAEVLES